MTDKPKPKRNYPFRGKIYTAEQIDELIESSGSFDPDDYYDKTATDTLLDTKQDVLTAGTGINIDDNVISTIPSGWRVLESSEFTKSDFVDSNGIVLQDFIIELRIAGAFVLREINIKDTKIVSNRVYKSGENNSLFRASFTDLSMPIESNTFVARGYTYKWEINPKPSTIQIEYYQIDFSLDNIQYYAISVTNYDKTLSANNRYRVWVRE